MEKMQQESSTITMFMMLFLIPYERLISSSRIIRMDSFGMNNQSKYFIWVRFVFFILSSIKLEKL
jgi:hypothetical protein